MPYHISMILLKKITAAPKALPPTSPASGPERLARYDRPAAIPPVTNAKNRIRALRTVSSGPGDGGGNMTISKRW